MGTSVAPTIAASAVLGALVYKLIDFVKYLVAITNKSARSEGLNGLATLAVSVVAGELAVIIFRQTQWASEITVGNSSLATLSTGSWLVFGLVVTSIASSLYDLKKAIDKTDTASTPRLLKDAEKRRKEVLEATVSKASTPDNAG